MEIGAPVVSRDGSQIAFIQTSRIGDQISTRVIRMSADGSAPQAVAELRAPAGAIRGVAVPSPLAWSGDMKTIAYVGEIKKSVSANRPRQALDRFAVHNLALIDVDSGHAEEIRIFERRAFAGPFLTTQAWDPTGRRLVYGYDGQIFVLDTATRSEERIARGEVPTWSPDGALIAVREREDSASGTEGDYVTVAASALHERALLLANPRPRLSLRPTMRRGFFGEANWSPDGRFIIVRRYRTFHEGGAWHALDRKTGDVGTLSDCPVGASIGGKA
jgi:Tol biopolymer transport system component